MQKNLTNQNKSPLRSIEQKLYILITELFSWQLCFLFSCQRDEPELHGEKREWVPFLSLLSGLVSALKSQESCQD